MKKKSFIYLAAIIAALLCLTFVLLFFERGSEDSSIKTVSDALWYTVVTLTTVGYGDYYPVTAPGRLVGSVIVLCSLGVIANIIAGIVSLLNGGIMPGIYLKHNRKKNWYVFSEANEKTNSLMSDIKKNEDAVVICLSDKKKWNFSWEEIIRMKADTPDTLHLFFMDERENDYLNFCAASEVYRDYIQGEVIPFHVYCMTEYKPEKIYVNLRCFHVFENTARLYWSRYPLNSDSEKIVIAGGGKYSEEILRYALQGNVIKPVQNVQYHVFMDEQNFLMNHYCIKDYFSVDESSDKVDSVFFYSSSWREERRLLEEADRIIFCSDNESENLSSVSDLRKYFSDSPDKQVHVLSFSSFEDIKSFGANQEIFTEDIVVREKLNLLAVSMNEYYCQSSETEQPDWNHLSEFKRQSNFAAADHVLYKLRYLNAGSGKEAVEKFENLNDIQKNECRRMEHERWMRFHIMNNWCYNSERNNQLRHHPDICPFDDLSESSQAKDDYAWEILKNIR